MYRLRSTCNLKQILVCCVKLSHENIRISSEYILLNKKYCHGRN